jgi:hypothetical protein
MADLDPIKVTISAEITDFTTALTQCTQAINSFASSADTSLGQVNTSLASLNTAMSTLSTSTSTAFQQVNTSLASINTSMSTLATSISSANTSITSLNTSIPTLGTTLQNNTTTVNSSASAFSGLSTALSTAGVDTAALDTAMTLASTGGIVALVAVLAGLATAATEASTAFQNASADIQRATGATGDTLNSLNATAETLFTTLPTDLGTITTVLDNLHTRLGTTGDDLTALSTIFINLGIVTNSDPGNLSYNIGKLMEQFKTVNSQDITTNLKEMETVVTHTGTSITDLTSGMISIGPVAQEMGLTFDQTAALVGTLQQHGVEATTAMSALRFLMKQMSSQDIKDFSGEFAFLVEKIKDEPDAAKAAGEALAYFGTRGQVMFTAIRSGGLDLQSLLDIMHNAPVDINALATSTETLAQSFTKLKNAIVDAISAIGLTGALQSAIQGITTVVKGGADAWAGVLNPFEARLSDFNKGQQAIATPPAPLAALAPTLSTTPPAAAADGMGITPSDQGLKSAADLKAGREAAKEALKEANAEMKQAKDYSDELDKSWKLLGAEAGPADQAFKIQNAFSQLNKEYGNSELFTDALTVAHYNMGLKMDELAAKVSPLDVAMKALGATASDVATNKITELNKAWDIVKTQFDAGKATVGDLENAFLDLGDSITKESEKADPVFKAMANIGLQGDPAGRIQKISDSMTVLAAELDAGTISQDTYDAAAIKAQADIATITTSTSGYETALKALGVTSDYVAQTNMQSLLDKQKAIEDAYSSGNISQNDYTNGMVAVQAQIDKATTSMNTYDQALAAVGQLSEDSAQNQLDTLNQKLVTLSNASDGSTTSLNNLAVAQLAASTQANTLNSDLNPLNTVLKDLGETTMVTGATNAANLTTALATLTSNTNTLSSAMGPSALQLTIDSVNQKIADANTAASGLGTAYSDLNTKSTAQWAAIQKTNSDSIAAILADTNAAGDPNTGTLITAWTGYWTQQLKVDSATNLSMVANDKAMLTSLQTQESLAIDASSGTLTGMWSNYYAGITSAEKTFSTTVATDLFDGKGSLFSRLGDAFVTLGKNIATAFATDAIDAFVKYVTANLINGTLFPSLTKLFTDLGGTISGVFSKITSQFSGLASQLGGSGGGGIAGGAGQLPLASIPGAMPGLDLSGGLAGTLPDASQLPLADLGSSMPGIGSALDLSGGVASAGSGIMSGVSGAISGISGLLTGGIGAVVGSAISAVTSIVLQHQQDKIFENMQSDMDLLRERLVDSHWMEDYRDWMESFLWNKQLVALVDIWSVLSSIHDYNKDWIYDQGISIIKTSLADINTSIQALGRPNVVNISITGTDPVTVMNMLNDELQAAGYKLAS